MKENTSRSTSMLKQRPKKNRGRVEENKDMSRSVPGANQKDQCSATTLPGKNGELRNLQGK